jgi:hypothetical protein
MTRFIHDQFAKQYLTELLTPYGQVETSKDITAEVRQIDLLFIPDPQPAQSQLRKMQLLISAVSLDKLFSYLADI